MQCNSCKNSFETVVLANRMMATGDSVDSGRQDEVNPATLDEDLLKILALMMIEDGQVTENEIRIARRLYENMTEENLTREHLGHMCSQVRLHRLNTLSFLATANQRRSHEEKLLLVQAMFGVAGADGSITPKRMESLVQAQQVLGLDEREFATAIQATDQWLA